MSGFRAAAARQPASLTKCPLAALQAAEPQAEPSAHEEDPKEAPAAADGAPVAGAWAYQGAPRPPNDAERVALLQSLGVLDGEEGEEPSQFDAITRLLCAVFGVPIALVSLVDAGGCCQQGGKDPAGWARILLRFLTADAGTASHGMPCQPQASCRHGLVSVQRHCAAARPALASHGQLRRCPRRRCRVAPAVAADLFCLPTPATRHPPACPTERQWFKSVQGLAPCIRATDRNESFCAWTLLPDQPHVMVRAPPDAPHPIWSHAGTRCSAVFP